MGLSNDAVMSGHQWLHQARASHPFRGSVPVPAPHRHWLDEFYDRKATVGFNILNPFDLYKGYKAGVDTLTNKPLPAAKNTPIPTVTNDPVLMPIYAAADRIYQLLRSQGLSERAATFGMYQVYFETQAFTSPLYRLHNNASGIKYAGQRGAVKGPAPMHYAFFPNGLEDWARAEKHELTKGRNPAGAATIEDFAARLKANGFYESPYDLYVSGLKRARLVLRAMPAADNADGTTDYDPETGISKPKPPQKKGIPWWGWGLIGIGGFVILKKIAD